MCSLKDTLAFHLLPFASLPSSPCFLIFSLIFLPILLTPSPCSNLYTTNSSPTFSWKPSQLDTNNQITTIRCDMQDIFNINTSQMSSNQSMGMHQSQDREAPCCARFNSLIPGIQEVARFGEGVVVIREWKTPETWQAWDSGYFITGIEYFHYFDKQHREPNHSMSDFKIDCLHVSEFQEALCGGRWFTTWFSNQTRKD